MKRIKLKNKCLIIILALFSIIFSNEVLAQFEGDVDKKFKEAREFAFDGEREKSIDLLNNILTYYPNYDDVRMFLSRVYAWEKRFDEARNTLNPIITKEKNEIVDLQLDIELWSKNYENLILVANRGLASSPNNESYLYKKALAQKKLNNLQDAGETIYRLLNLNPSNEKAISMRNLLKHTGIINAVSANYNLTTFDSNFDPWHLAYLELSRKFGFGSLIFRLNYASRFQTNDYQFEADSYIRIFDGMYSYVNLGYSPADLFPDFRFGIEPYFKLPYAMEISFGYRYLLFGEKGVNLYTGHLGKYLGNYWISFRPFLTPKTDRTDFSGIFIIRRYLSDSDNYISLQGGMGFIPSDELNNTEFLNIDSKKIGLEYQSTLSKYYILKIASQYSYEEYYPEKWRNSYEFKLGLKRRF
ncbi:MAG: YaiO family outer membrane beta-barrel protein [Ignavibacteriae bacterium]|nr:YaiO family outer membrane beta-barrel protein [Ignavibacteriota bacterium]